MPSSTERWTLEPKKAWTPAELLRIAFSHPVNSAPDTEFEYCNTNTVLLGLIIEKLTGMSASDALRERDLFAAFGPEADFASPAR